MLYFFFFNWVLEKPLILFNCFFKLKKLFFKKLFFIKNWTFFFFKTQNFLKSNKYKLNLKKKKKKSIINSFLKLNKSSYHINEIKIIFIMSWRQLLLVWSKSLLFFFFFSTLYFFFKNFITSCWPFSLIFFFKKNISLFSFKKVFSLFLIKFIKRKRRFRRKKRFKKRSLRTLFFKKKTHHRSYLKFFSKKSLLSKSYIYFYSLLWRTFKILKRKKRKLRPRFKRRFIRRKKRLIKIRIFLKKILSQFAVKARQIYTTQKLKKIYKNYYFPKLFNKKYNIKLYGIHKKKKYLNFIKFFSLFIIQTLENIFKNKFLILLKFTRNKRLNKALRYQYRKSSKFQRKIGHGFFLKEMLFILWLSFKSKDILFLVLWIKRTMERIRRRKQKLFLIALRFVLKKSISPYLYYLRCYGYRCVLWGKIGVSGNAKTRNFVCKNKFYSLTTKTYKNTHEFTTINTHTGVLGLSFFLIF